MPNSMYRITLTLSGDSRSESLNVPTIDKALSTFTQWLDYYSTIKRRLNIKGNYQLTLSTQYHEIVKAETI